MSSETKERILIFLLGSLGDTLVALPALHLVARRFPFSERRVLTNLLSHPKAPSMADILDGTGLVHGYFQFPGPSRQKSRLRLLVQLGRQIRAWGPTTLVYLHQQRGQRIALRDAVVFRLLGIRRLVGVPISKALQQTPYDERSGRFEHRSEYLARSLEKLGDVRLADRASWDLVFSPAERARANAEITSLRAAPGVLAMSIGYKAEVKDWGDENWRALLAELSNRLPGWGLVALGAPVEAARSSALLEAWKGPSLNLCGQLSIRESGAILERSRVFIGHDSGPMHLAATVGTTCAAIFSARSLPGQWFPYGPKHEVFYKRTECAGCELDVCVEFKKKCITAVTVREVTAAVIGLVRHSTGQHLTAIEA